MVIITTKYKFLLISACFLIGVSFLCLLLMFAVYYIYGEPKQITTDASDPDITEGVARYMDKDTFQKYNSVRSFIGGTGFISGLSGVFLYLIWKMKIK
jgi:hypothetical protein